MLTKLQTYAREVQQLLADGKSLKQIRQWSFEQRETRQDVPYLATYNMAPNGQILELMAQPTKKQQKLFQFFAEKAPNSVLPRYTLRVTANGVRLEERLGRGIDNVRVLFSESPGQTRKA